LADRPGGLCCCDHPRSAVCLAAVAPEPSLLCSPSACWWGPLCPAAHQGRAAAAIQPSPHGADAGPSAAGPAPQPSAWAEPWELASPGLGPWNWPRWPLGPLVVNRAQAELAQQRHPAVSPLIPAPTAAAEHPSEELVCGLPGDHPLRCWACGGSAVFSTLLAGAAPCLPWCRKNSRTCCARLPPGPLNLAQPCLKGALEFVLGGGERCWANLLLAAEQGRRSPVARAGPVLPPTATAAGVPGAHPLQLDRRNRLIALLGLRWQYGAL